MENTNNLKPELCFGSKWWIPKDRYYELKHFCHMYPTYKRVQHDVTENSIKSSFIVKANNQRKRPYAEAELVEKAADILAACSRRIGMVDAAAEEADKTMSEYIIKGVTENLSYDVLKVRYNIPCSRDTYYDLYRKFFWHLDKIRD